MNTLLRTSGLGLLLLGLALPASAQRAAPPDSDVPGTVVSGLAYSDDTPPSTEDMDRPQDVIRRPSGMSNNVMPSRLDTDEKSTATAAPRMAEPFEWLNSGRDGQARASGQPMPDRFTDLSRMAVDPLEESNGRDANARAGTPRESLRSGEDVALLDNGRDANATPSGAVVAEDGAVVTEEAATASVQVEVPTGSLALSPNYPNPFQGTTTVTFIAPTAGHARMALYDIRGRELAVLFDGVVQAGQHQRVTVNAADLAVGTYIYTLEHGGERLSRQLQVIR